MQTPEEFAEEIVSAYIAAGSGTPRDLEGNEYLTERIRRSKKAAAALVRARDAEVVEFSQKWEEAKDGVLRAWVEPGINPPYHERMKAQVREIMPTLGRRLDDGARRRSGRYSGWSVFVCDRSDCPETLTVESDDSDVIHSKAIDVGWAVCPTPSGFARTYCPKHRPGRRLFDRKGARR